MNASPIKPKDYYLRVHFTSGFMSLEPKHGMKFCIKFAMRLSSNTTNVLASLSSYNMRRGSYRGSYNMSSY